MSQLLLNHAQPFPIHPTTTIQPSFGSNTRTTRFRLNLPTSLISQLQPILKNNSPQPPLARAITVLILSLPNHSSVRPTSTTKRNGGRGTFAAHGDGETPAFYRTNFARAPARQSDGLTFGIPSPAFPRTDFARIRKADADSTISQPRYGRNQPPLNHDSTILRVESKNDSDTTILHS